MPPGAASSGKRTSRRTDARADAPTGAGQAAGVWHHRPDPSPCDHGAQAVDIALAAHAHPPLSTLPQLVEAAGQMLGASLKTLLAGEPPLRRTLPTEPIVRDSSRR